jgi:hypothetical protein
MGEMEKTIESFVKQFGELDEYKIVALNYFFEIMYGKNICLPSEEGPLSSEVNNDIAGTEMPPDEIE